MSKLTKEEVAGWIRNLVPYLEKPQALAPDGYFKNKNIESEPGKVLEYSDCLSPNNVIHLLEQTENIKALIELYKVVE